MVDDHYVHDPFSCAAPQKTIPIEQGLKQTRLVDGFAEVPQKTIPIEQGLKQEREVSWAIASLTNLRRPFQ